MTTLQRWAAKFGTFATSESEDRRESSRRAISDALGSKMVEYHSRDWDSLVERGWTTSTVETLSCGRRLAIMVRR